MRTRAKRAESESRRYEWESGQGNQARWLATHQHGHEGGLGAASPTALSTARADQSHSETAEDQRPEQNRHGVVPAARAAAARVGADVDFTAAAFAKAHKPPIAKPASAIRISSVPARTRTSS
jgi:hypothetical protein